MPSRFISIATTHHFRFFALSHSSSTLHCHTAYPQAPIAIQKNSITSFSVDDEKGEKIDKRERKEKNHQRNRLVLREVGDVEDVLDAVLGKELLGFLPELVLELAGVNAVLEVVAEAVAEQLDDLLDGEVALLDDGLEHLDAVLLDKEAAERADGDGDVVVEHETDGVTAKRRTLGVLEHLGREADLDRDAKRRDVVHETREVVQLEAAAQTRRTALVDGRHNRVDARDACHHRQVHVVRLEEVERALEEAERVCRDGDVAVDAKANDQALLLLELDGQLRHLAERDRVVRNNAHVHDERHLDRVDGAELLHLAADDVHDRG